MEACSPSRSLSAFITKLEEEQHEIIKKGLFDHLDSSVMLDNILSSLREVLKDEFDGSRPIIVQQPEGRNPIEESDKGVCRSSPNKFEGLKGSGEDQSDEDSEVSDENEEDVIDAIGRFGSNTISKFTSRYSVEISKAELHNKCSLGMITCIGFVTLVTKGLDRVLYLYPSLKEQVSGGKSVYLCSRHYETTSSLYYLMRRG
eukprot:TRINITY_DN3860_c0_g1_i19.p2 TRINITY_DN3860_c0_g1~~TRINITY_DN3860_c0_g1_i19.p2  ORF type:complete len:202 (-),score=37.58 TRINITY_DN3860_c0_g1_i19:2765-3370(-)